MASQTGRCVRTVDPHREIHPTMCPTANQAFLCVASDLHRGYKEQKEAIGNVTGIGSHMDFQSHEEKDTVLDSIADGVFTVNRDWRITSFNRAAEQITGVSRQDAIGRPCREILKADVCETGCALRQTMETGQPIISKPVDIIDAHGRRKPITISTALLRNEKGQVVGGVETFRDMTLVEELRKQVQRQYSCEDIISRSPKVQQLFDVLPRVAESDCTVLIEGETGTGKELFARAVHSLGRRKGEPFVAVNCGALPDTLLESELFGYKAGAFTDAKRDKAGRFRLAEKGTLFLDEIGDITPAMQVRLLRVLQEKTYEPLGSTESVRHDVRIIAATNKNLEERVRQGLFREDLFYRINVFKITLPPLRERMEDVPLLADHFIRRFNVLQQKEIEGLSEEALACLMAYDYPGNIRELGNIIERAFILCKAGRIEKIHLPESLFKMGGGDPRPEPLSLREMEAIHLTNALRANDWNRLRTARQLGIHKTTLYRKIKALRIVTPE